MNQLFCCQQCHSYTFEGTCRCGGSTVSPRPPKYKPEDKYKEYRRKTKTDDWMQRGYL